MAEQQPEMSDAADDKSLEDTTAPNYKPPAPKSLTEIHKMDEEDESLVKYKQALLGEIKEPPFPDDPRNVIVMKLVLHVENRPDLELDLTQNPDDLKNNVFTMKEGCQYHIKIYFYVQREIVAGLRYHQKSYRKGITVDKLTLMVGSYGPKDTMHCYTTPINEAPVGLISRGSYTIKSVFMDDDKNVHCKWDWQLNIKKDWDDE